MLELHKVVAAAQDYASQPLVSSEVESEADLAVLSIWFQAVQMSIATQPFAEAAAVVNQQHCLLLVQRLLEYIPAVETHQTTEEGSLIVEKLCSCRDSFEWVSTEENKFCHSPTPSSPLSIQDIQLLADHVLRDISAHLQDSLESKPSLVKAAISATFRWMCHGLVVFALSKQNNARAEEGDSDGVLMSKWKASTEKAAKLTTIFPTSAVMANFNVSLFLMLLFSPELAVQQWARTSLISLLYRGSAEGNKVVEPSRQLQWLCQIGVQIVAALFHFSTVPFHCIAVGLKVNANAVMAFGIVHVLLIVVTLEHCSSKCLSAFPPSDGPAPHPSITSSMLLLAGRLLLLWLFRSLEFDADGRGVLAVVSHLNRLLSTDLTLTPSLCLEVRRALLKSLINSISAAAGKSRATSAKSKYPALDPADRWLRFLWQFTVVLSPPTSAPRTQISGSCGSVEWIWKALWKYWKEYYHVASVMEETQTFSQSSKDSKSLSGIPSRLITTLKQLHVLVSSICSVLPAFVSSKVLYDALALDLEKLKLLLHCSIIHGHDCGAVEMVHFLFRVSILAKSAVPIQQHSVLGILTVTRLRREELEERSSFDSLWDWFSSMFAEAYAQQSTLGLLCKLLETLYCWLESSDTAIFLLTKSFLVTAVDHTSRSCLSTSQQNMLRCLDRLAAVLHSQRVTAVERLHPLPSEGNFSNILQLAAVFHQATVNFPESALYRLASGITALFAVSSINDSSGVSAAVWCLEKVVLKQPVLQDAATDFALHDSSVDQLGRSQGKWWLRLLSRMLQSSDSLAYTDIAQCWWLLAIICDVAQLDGKERELLCEVIPNLPPIVTESFSDPESRPSNHRQVNAGAAYQLQRFLFCSLLHQSTLYPATSLVPALLHVAGSMNMERAASDSVLFDGTKKMLCDLLRHLDASTAVKDVLSKYAPIWLKKALTAAQAMMDNAEKLKQLKLHALVVMEKERSENLKNQRDAHEMGIAIPVAVLEHLPLSQSVPLRPNSASPPDDGKRANPVRPDTADEIDIYADQVSVHSSCSSSNDSLHEAMMARKKRRAEVEIQVKQYYPNVLHESKATPGPQLLHPQDLQGGLVPQHAVMQSPTSSQLHHQKMNELRSDVQSRRELRLDFEALLRRIAASTSILTTTPGIQDILQRSEISDTGTLPIIPNEFQTSTENSNNRSAEAFKLYINTFVPHIFVEMRYNVNKAVWNLVEEGRLRARKVGSRRNSTANEEEMSLSIFKHIAKDAYPAVCNNRHPTDPLDPAAVRFSVSFTSSTPPTAGVVDGDLVLMLLPVEAVRHAIAHRSTSSSARSGSANSSAFPSLWSQLGGLAQLCVVDANEKRTATFRVYPSEEAVPSPISFVHALHISFTGKGTKLFVFPLMSLKQHLFTLQSLLKMSHSIFRCMLCHPNEAAAGAVAVHNSLQAFLQRPHVLEHVMDKLSHAARLNEWQAKAVASCMYFVDPLWDRRDTAKAVLSYTPPPATVAGKSPVILVEGPPGTGKTQTIGMLLLTMIRYLSSGHRILVCAPSNCAVDAVLIRLLYLEGKEKLQKCVPGSHRFVRIGVREKVDEEVLSFTHPLYLEDIVQQLRHSGVSTSNRIGTGNPRQDQLKLKVLKCAKVIFSTLGSLSQLEGNQFDVVVVDEVSQATEPDIVQALSLSAGKCILVGDSKQLQPTVLSQESARNGMERSLLARLLQGGFPSMLLRMQYRMHPDICRFPSEYVYNGQLVTAESVMQRQLTSAVPKALGSTRRFQFIDVPSGVMMQSDVASVFNKEEAKELVRYMRFLRHQLSLSVPEFNRYCGVITFYRAQCTAIRNALTAEERETLTVATVDSYQGREMDIILISCVRTPMGNASKSSLGFLTDIGRVNVALTRARDMCVVFGHKETLMSGGGGAHSRSSTKFSSHDPEMLRHMILSEMSILRGAGQASLH